MSAGSLPFQSTHPRGVRRRPCLRPHCRWARFNPRTRVGCDARHRRLRCGRWPGFNPRTRVGCDAVLAHHVRGVLAVSIHAPAWGATPTLMATSRWCWGFNPRTRVGCDLLPTSTPWPTCAFQSTHPRGVRHGLHGLCGCDGKRFNPRTRVGCDAPSLSACRVFGRFNPRTRVGCDQITDKPLHISSAFQSTHPRGVRQTPICRAPDILSVSIHAPAWGATRRRLPVLPCIRWFQSTHPRGVRQSYVSCKR